MWLIGFLGDILLCDVSLLYSGGVHGALTGCLLTSILSDFQEVQKGQCRRKEGICRPSCVQKFSFKATC